MTRRGMLSTLGVIGSLCTSACAVRRRARGTGSPSSGVKDTAAKGCAGPLLIGGWEDNTGDYNPLVQMMVTVYAREGGQASAANGTGYGQLATWYGSYTSGTQGKAPGGGGGTPDVFLFTPAMQDPTAMTGFDAAFAALDLSSFAKTANLDLGQFAPAVISACYAYPRLGGSFLAALPLTRDPLVLAFNKTLLDQIGVRPQRWSSSDFLATCARSLQHNQNVRPIGATPSLLDVAVSCLASSRVPPVGNSSQGFTSDGALEAFSTVFAYSEYMPTVGTAGAVTRGEAVFEFTRLSQVLAARQQTQDVDFVPVPVIGTPASTITTFGLSIARATQEAGCAFGFVETQVLSAQWWSVGRLGLPALTSPAGAKAVLADLGTFSGLRDIIDGSQTDVAANMYLGGAYRLIVAQGIERLLGRYFGSRPSQAVLRSALQAVSEEVQQSIDQFKATFGPA